MAIATTSSRIEMSFRHRFKRLTRDTYSALFVYSGLAKFLANRGGPRLLILAGHSVDAGESSDGLPADLKISPDRLERLLRRLSRYARWVTVGEGVGELKNGSGRGLVALSMDDGYLDNRTQLLPLLESCDARCTVYLEGRPLEERRVSWLHQWFWLENELGPGQAGQRCAAQLGEHADGLAEQIAAGRGDLGNWIKRRFKYHIPREPRDRAVQAVFEGAGGDERSLCDRLYLSLDEARELQASGRVELGGHTYSHEVLSTLDDVQAQAEIGRGQQALQAQLGADCGRSFAYPFGRRWDHAPAHAQAVKAAGYQSAATTHAGLNRSGTDPLQLKRWMLSESLPAHLLITEVCGGFDFLRRMGLDLVE